MTSRRRGDLAALFAVIDGANADDPNPYRGEPLALVQGRLAESWVTRLDPTASDALRVAARAHHLRRWVVPRASYPEGRRGYLRWRRDQQARHARELTELLASAGAGAELAARAGTIVRKQGLGADPEVQVFEDAVCLVFLETQFVTTAGRLDDDTIVDVVAKTLKKMSPAGHAAAATVELDDRMARVVERATTVLSAGA